MCSYDPCKKCHMAEGWTLTTGVSAVSKALRTAHGRRDSEPSFVLNEVPTALVPPTFFRTNKFTAAFQDIVNAYGIPAYRELNPAPFTIVTLPLMFAIMFGDVVHGLILALVALWMVVDEKRLHRTREAAGEVFEMLFGARYVILLMGLFAVYLGLIYNDLLSKHLRLFASAFAINHKTATATILRRPDGSPRVYPFGLDWAWMEKNNQSLYFNSYKMKQSIVIGVLHLLFGIILSAFNYTHFGDTVGLLAVFLPQFVFMSAIMGYLLFLILFKWSTQTPASPSILSVFVNMLLAPSRLLPSERFYPGQHPVQLLLLALAGVSVLLMLFLKPLWLLLRNRNHPVQETPSEDPFSFASELMESALHTVEFVLGSVSNTTSYLRLWALSLAHEQLSAILWTMTMEKLYINPLITIVAAAGWLFFTVAFLVAMEGLSAFLHSLRLHWIEFYGKFAHCNGYEYHPLGFHALLTTQKDDDS